MADKAAWESLYETGWLVNVTEVRAFLRESNRIEGITRAPSRAEVAETERFLMLGIVTIPDLERLVSVYAPGAVLRSSVGLDVRVGGYIAPRGGPEIVTRLDALLDDAGDLGAYQTHVEYEKLHPFMDGNGRSGRALWLKQMGNRAPLGFLHEFYYQALSNSRSRAPRERTNG